MGSTWVQPGLGSTWGPSGPIHLGSTWAGVNLGSIWPYPVVNLMSTWGQPGIDMGETSGQQPAPPYHERDGGVAHGLILSGEELHDDGEPTGQGLTDNAHHVM